MIGKTILHYKILSKLGEGGMGVVYKAEDTKLKREVAIKFLPRQIAASGEERERFKIEAQAAAALNHTNIATVYNIEDAEDETFIVMEYVKGQELKEKIDAGPRPIDDTLNLAIQIANGLQSAHEEGVVHRDIKSANIMLTQRGDVKIMDFGLAKRGGQTRLTKEGTTLGTVAYMSPEQTRGDEVDQRSDIFSLGVLIYEMLTGRLPFKGDYDQAVTYSILNEEPEPVTGLRTGIPMELEQIVSKCLEKDPSDRYQRADELVVDLRKLKKESETRKILSQTGHKPVQQRGKRPAFILPAVIALLILASIGWFLFAPKGISINPSMTTRVLQVPFTQYSYHSLSPDGKWIAFPAADANGKWDIYYMHVNGEEPRKITSDATIFIQQGANISPDGSQIVYDRPNEDDTSHDIFAVSALGGTSKKLAETGSAAQWRTDGERVGFIRTTGSHVKSESGYIEFWTVGADGSDLRREFADSLFYNRGGYRYNFCWSPDGASIAWIRTLPGNSQLLIVRELETGNERQLTEGNENIDAIAWTADDRIIFSSNRGGNTNLWAIPASGGTAVQVTKGGGPDIALSIAASGNELVYLQQQPVGYLWIANMDGSEPRQITFDDRLARHPSFSPDKGRAAFVMNDPDPLTESRDVYVIDRDGNHRRRLTTGLTNALIPTWSPDGSRIKYSVPPTGQGADTAKTKIYVVNVDNPGAPAFAGDHIGHYWLDNDHILSLDRVRSYIVTVSEAKTRRFFADSLLVWHITENQIGYYDRRFGKEGWWVVNTQPTTLNDLLKQTEDVIMPVLKGVERKVSSASSPFRAWTSRPSTVGEFLQYTGDGKVRKISFASRNEEVLPASFTGLRYGSFPQMSADGEEIVFVTARLSSKLILLENIFK